MNEHGGHIHYPAFLGNSPVTADDINTVIAYAGHRTDVLNNANLIRMTIMKSSVVVTSALSRIQRQGRA